MIVWINGAFGVGKTETAKALHGRLPKSHLYDPELVGQFLWYCFPEGMKRQGDFQDIPLWRSINVEILRYLAEHHHGPLIVPMTLVDRGYADEVLGGLRVAGIPIAHYILTAPKAVIRQRLLARGEPEHSWAEMQIDRCLAAFASDIDGVQIDTSGLTIEQTVDCIIRQTDFVSACGSAGKL